MELTIHTYSFTSEKWGGSIKHPKAPLHLFLFLLLWKNTWPRTLRNEGLVLAHSLEVHSREVTATRAAVAVTVGTKGSWSDCTYSWEAEWGMHACALLSLLYLLCCQLETQSVAFYCDSLALQETHLTNISIQLFSNGCLLQWQLGLSPFKCNAFW